MAHQQLLPDRPCSTYSRPRRDHADGSYEIHLIKADDPAYLPADFELWPIFYQSILDVLFAHPAAHDAAVDAVLKKRAELQGLRNRDIPPGSVAH